MVAIIDKALRKRRSYGKPATRAPTLKRVRFGYRLLAVKNMSVTFNKLFIFAFFAFCVYTLFFYKQSIFDSLPENCLSFSKKSPLKTV